MIDTTDVFPNEKHKSSAKAVLYQNFEKKNDESAIVCTSAGKQN